MVCSGRKKLTAISQPTGTLTVAGSLTISAPGGMVTMVRPLKVRPAEETRLMVLPPWLTPTLAAPMRSGSEPNSLVKWTRTWGPPMEMWTISRTVVSAVPLLIGRADEERLGAELVGEDD